jgi:chemotaxis signal transduction protein
MEENAGIILPESGTDENALAKFIDDAQKQADRNRETMESRETKTAYHLVAFQLDREIFGVEIDKKRLGMLVDSVSHVIKLSSACIEDIPEETVTVDENFIQGVGKLEQQLIIILELNRSLLLTEGS